MDGDDPPPKKPLSVRLLEDNIYVFSKSLKYGRARGLRNLTWWGSERIEFLNGYNFNPNIIDEDNYHETKPVKKVGLSSRILWVFRKKVGVGFYHKPIFRNKLIWRIFIENINKFLPYPYPDMSQGPVEQYPLQINLDCDILIIGGGIAGLTVAKELAGHGLNIVVLDGDKYSIGGFAGLIDGYSERIKRLHNQLRKRGVKIIGGAVFQGFLEDSYIAYKYDTNQTILVNTNRVVIATGAYEAPPLFENNDLPMIMSLTTLLKLNIIYEYKPSGNVVIIGGMGDLIPALETLTNRGIKPILIYRGKIPSPIEEYVRDRGIEYYDHVEYISVSGINRVENIRLRQRDGDTIRINSVSCLAYTPIVTPDKEITAQLNTPYVFDSRLGGYIPLHNIYGELDVDEPNVIVVGGAGAYLPLDVIEDYSAGVARYLLNKDYGIGKDYERLFQSVLSRLEHQYRDIYDGLLALDNAFKDRKIYEYVGWEDPPNLFRGDESKIFVCFDIDVLYSDLIHAYRDLDIWRMEHIKRYTGLGTGICQGRGCQLNASIILHKLSGKSFIDIGRFRARFPVIPQTLLSLGGVEI